MSGRLAGWIPYLAVTVGLHRIGSAWAAMYFYHGLVLLYLAADRSGPSWRELGRGWRRGLGPGVCAAGFLGGAAILWVQPSAALGGYTLTWRLTELHLPPELWIPFCLYFLAVGPALEEWFWRGRLASASRWPDRSDVMFAGYHVLVLVKFWKLPWTGAAFVALLLGAWLLRLVRIRTGGLAIPFLAHLAADVGVLAGVILAVG